MLFVSISSKSLDDRENVLIQKCNVKEFSAIEEKPRKGFFRRKRKQG